MLTKLKSFEFSKVTPLVVTLVFVIILIQYSFYPLESIFYDSWMKMDSFLRTTESPVVMITLDEESDQFLGESYPYTYSSHVKLLERVIGEKPLAVSYLVSLMEPDSDVEISYQARMIKKLKEYSRDGDKFKFGTEIDNLGELLPPENLREFGYFLAQIYKDQLIFSKDEVVRRSLLSVSGEETLYVWAANKFRSFIGEEPLNVRDIHGSYYSSEADANFVLFKYSENQFKRNEVFSSISFHRVVVGNIPQNFFKDKIVLVGSKYLSDSNDYVFTPLSRKGVKTDKISVKGEIINSLIQKKTIYEIKSSVSKLLALILSLILSFLISKVQPVKGLMITVVLILSILMISFMLFSLFGIWLQLAHLTLSIFVVYYIWVPFRAIEEYQTRYAIQEETKILKQVDKLKQNFISLMSHDLKTPVAKILGIADILKLKLRSNSEAQDLIDNIFNATKELNNFITSILDLTKIESQNLTLNKESRDINKIIENLVNKLSFEIRSRNMTIDTELSPLYPIQIDSVLINRVLSNLIENSIKYAGEGKKISIKTWDDDQYVFIQISDNGMGISSEDLVHIFDKFYRVKNDQTHSIKGSGLGLYLVKYFIELHEGFISAHSIYGDGISFTIKLKNV